LKPTSTNTIRIQGARAHNLKNIDIELPRNQLVLITGVSGSDKSSLAFDTLYAEGQRRYVESLSAYARQFLGIMERPDVDSIEGLSPAISIEQKTTSRNPRSTVIRKPAWNKNQPSALRKKPILFYAHSVRRFVRNIHKLMT